jgi:hypothetical protein
MTYLRGRNSERLYTEAAHLLEADDFDYETAGAWLAGHDAAESLIRTGSRASKTVEAVDATLSAETDAQGKLRLVGDVANDVWRYLRLTTSYHAGFRSAIKGDGPDTARS